MKDSFRKFFIKIYVSLDCIIKTLINRCLENLPVVFCMIRQDSNLTRVLSDWILKKFTSIEVQYNESDRERS